MRNLAFMKTLSMKQENKKLQSRICNNYLTQFLIEGISKYATPFLSKGENKTSNFIKTNYLFYDSSLLCIKNK